IQQLKWATGTRDVLYFNGTGTGTVISGTTFSVNENGSYTVYALDEAGNEQVETIAITNIISEAPTVILDYNPKTAVRTGVDVTIAASVSSGVAGNVIKTLKWAAGERTTTDFASPTFGTDVAVGGTFHVTANGTYTVYAADSAGNEKTETIVIANIVAGEPVISLDYSPKTPTNAGVDITVTAAVSDDAAANEIETLKWAAGERTTADFTSPTFGTDVAVGGTFHVTANGTYTVYAADLTGNKKTETIVISNIVMGEPTISLDYSPKTPTNAGVDIMVTASVSDEAAGNEIEVLKWAAGTLTETDFDSPTFGTDVPAFNKFHVSANGTYTVYAADSAGNEKIETIEITNIIVFSGTTSGPPQDAIQDPTQFSLVPGKEYTLKVPGLTLQIPAGAIEKATTITIRKVTSDLSGLMQPGQLLISGVYELTKDVPGKFIVPVRLSLALTSDRWDDNQNPALVYYDEETGEWVELGGTVTNGILTGETDHFTKFAVMPIANEPEVEPHIVLTDIAGHWGETLIREGVDNGLMEGYPDGTFRPYQFVTRAEFALMLHRVFAWPEGKGPLFQDKRDIPEWASGAVAAAVQASVINGYPDHTFRPGANINRLETAVMIAKAAGLQIQDAHKTPFADNSAIMEWALPYIHAAYEADLIQGNTGNRFRPLDFTTRAEAIVLLLRVASYIHTA
ncbi:S-layer homology domain-containing protein, partial [Paenibacillus sepulcri]|nr:S-layer homology domain-containing protein [Paenibacillus sepulcri]